MATNFYPRTDMEILGGNLQEIFDLSFKLENGAKVEDTFRGGGISFGPVKADGSFQVKAPAKAEERDYWDLVASKKITQLVFKHPSGRRMVFDCGMGSIDLKSGIDGATEQTVNWVGRLADKGTGTG